MKRFHKFEEIIVSVLHIQIHLQFIGAFPFANDLLICPGVVLLLFI